MIELVGLVKDFGALRAADHVDLTVGRGEVFGFIGRNGAGKTTAIRVLVGLLEPTAGHARLCGVDVWREPERAKARLGYLPDHPYLYEKLRGVELLRFAGRLHGLGRRQLEDRIERLLSELDLERDASDLVETYSHGRKQRLALAAALLHEPQVLVLDEPVVGLDPPGRRQLARLLRELASGGVTVLLSTHSLAVAEETCDRFGVLEAGRLVAEGDLEELRRRAATSRNGDAAPGSLESVFLSLLGGEKREAEREDERGSEIDEEGPL